MKGFGDVGPVFTCGYAPGFVKYWFMGMDGDGAVVIENPFANILYVLNVHAV